MLVGMKNYTHLSLKERELVFLHLNQGESLREIGKTLNRHHATILREVARNSIVGGKQGGGKYSPSLATSFVKRRRQESRRGKLDDLSLRHYVLGKLNRGWSPEQISGRLKLKAPNCYLSYETIYQFIYASENKPLRLWEFLRRGRQRRQSLYSRKANTRKRLMIPNKTSIECRPEEANHRLTLGHWESDLMEGRRVNQKVVAVTVDRKSRYLLLAQLEGKEATPRAKSLIEQLAKTTILPKTLTLDNGSENFKHELITKYLGCQTFFCHAYHSWEKGTVENTISLVRSYIPKGTDLELITKTDLNTIAWELNNRPRKILGFYTPFEVLYNRVDSGALRV